MTTDVFDQKKSIQMGLSFPYDWSNPNISDDSLILNVLKRGYFEDICRIVLYFGFDRVNGMIAEIKDDVLLRSLTRMMNNIKRSIDEA